MGRVGLLHRWKTGRGNGPVQKFFHMDGGTSTRKESIIMIRVKTSYFNTKVKYRKEEEESYIALDPGTLSVGDHILLVFDPTTKTK